MIHHMNKMKNRKHIITSTDAEKASDKIQHPFMKKKKTSQKIGYRRNAHEHNKDHI